MFWVHREQKLSCTSLSQHCRNGWKLPTVRLKFWRKLRILEVAEAPLLICPRVLTRRLTTVWFTRWRIKLTIHVSRVAFPPPSSSAASLSRRCVMFVRKPETLNVDPLTIWILLLKFCMRRVSCVRSCPVINEDNGKPFKNSLAKSCVKSVEREGG